ncbi:LysM peptidoglycan-binding domain-containing protein [Breznakiellaceae bacterium SP9]
MVVSRLSGKLLFLGVLFILLSPTVFSQAFDSKEARGQSIPIPSLPEAAAPDIPGSLEDNGYFLESQRLKKLAQEAFDQKDYERSDELALQAMEFAQKSDDHVRRQRDMEEANKLLAEAARKLQWAHGVDADKQYPNELESALRAYDEAQRAKRESLWGEVSIAASQVLNYLSAVTESSEQGTPEQGTSVRVVKISPKSIQEVASLIEPKPREPAPSRPVSPVSPGASDAGPAYSQFKERPWNITKDAFWYGDGYPKTYTDSSPWEVLSSINQYPPTQSQYLPAQYQVRPWAISLDCFWNIAGRDWAYGDPSKWRLLYNANKTKLADPNNPDVIEPGIILDIPSLNNEQRQGLWNVNQEAGANTGASRNTQATTDAAGQDAAPNLLRGIGR